MSGHLRTLGTVPGTEEAPCNYFLWPVCLTNIQTKSGAPELQPRLLKPCVGVTAQRPGLEGCFPLSKAHDQQGRSLVFLNNGLRTLYLFVFLLFQA